jgi:hypothetical protein
VVGRSACSAPGASSSLQKNATKIESACTAINAGIQRLLADALAALADAAADTPGDPAAGAVA